MGTEGPRRRISAGVLHRLVLLALVAAVSAPSAQSGALNQPARLRVDAALRIHGVSNALLLVRTASTRSGVTDEVFVVSERRLVPVPLVGGPYGGLVTAIVGRTYFDVDCGSGARTLVQLEIEPSGNRWHQTRHTFVLRHGRFELASVTIRTSPVAAAIHRRCAIVRW